jgi:hypothetical protein
MVWKRITQQSLAKLETNKHILVYFEGHFGSINNVFLAHHIQTVDKVRF